MELARASADPSAAVDALRRGDAARAAAIFQTTLASRPEDVPALHGMGLALLQMGRTAEAVRFVIEAHLLQPDDDEILRNLSAILIRMHRLDKAIECLNTVLTRNPSCAISMGLLGGAYSLMGRHEEAHPLLERAEALRPDESRRSGLLMARAAVALWTDHRRERERLSDAIRHALDTGQPPPCEAFSSIMLGLDAPLTRALARAEAPRSVAPPPPPVVGRQRIRVGYLSPDLHNHPVGLLLAPLLEQRDRSRFEVHAYGLRTIRDPVRARIEAACEAVLQLDDLDDTSVAERIAADAPDILVDLVGFTNAGRPGVLARRPAPVQVHWLGYPGSVPGGLVDYQILHPSRLGPDGDAPYDEAIVHLPETFVACEGFEAPASIPTRAELGLPEDRFVFGFFGATYRIEPSVFDAWCQILEAVPDAVLWIQNGHAAAQDNLRREARIRGIDPARLYFASWGLLSECWHHTRCDLWLDGWHVSSGTASIVAAWTGTPLLTLAGSTPQSRTGAGVLAGAGMGELIVDTDEAYIQRAIHLARNRSELAELKAGLEQSRDRRPLFDVPRFARHLERAFETMRARAVAGLAPESFEVEALPACEPE